MNGSKRMDEFPACGAGVETVSSNDQISDTAPSESGIKESKYNLLMCCPVPVSRSELRVDFSPRHDRRPHTDLRLEQTIESTWQQRTAAQPTLFNGTKFREVSNRESGMPGKVVLFLGLTDYRTFVGTNLSPQWEKFLVPSEDDVERCQHTASPFGNAAVVETSDERIILLQRSADVAEFPDTIVFPGGHPEPHEAGIEYHTVGSSVTEEERERRIIAEIFEGIIREVVEETGIPSSCLSDPLFIGCSRRNQNARPAAVFYLTTVLTSQQVLDVYQGAEHAYESTALHFVPPDGLMKVAETMPGCHHGGAALYNRLREQMKSRELIT